MERGIGLIYISSIAVHCPSDRNKVIGDDTQPHAASARNSVYARAKAEAESYLKRMCDRSGLRLVILRPGIVIGEGASPLHPGVGSFPYSLSLCVVPGKGVSALPIVLVDDCADAMALVVEKQLDGKDLSGLTFNLVDDPLLSASEYLKALEQATLVQIKTLHVPAWRTWLLELLKYSIKAAGGDKHARLPSYTGIKGSGFLSTYDNSNVKKILAWQPTSDRCKIIEEGIFAPAQQYLL